jgi:hypothetical protein
MLNVGSSTERFRTREQPWIDAQIFRPARDAGRRILHLDLKSAPGVDIIGSLADDSTLRRVRELGIRSALCSNLLEHVPDRDAVCRSIDVVVPPGGYIFVSCPNRYPLHLDPIDTMFRPNVEELAALFPNAQLVHGEVVSDGTYLDYVGRNPQAIGRRVLRLCAPFYKPKQWYTALHHVPWLFRTFSATCVLLRKPA